MSSNIFKKQTKVAGNLNKLGTSIDKLRVVIEAVATARASVTPNDPAGARGYLGWQMGTRRLREVHAGLDGWEKDDTDQVPTIRNEFLGIRIAILNTDDGTCIEKSMPKNRSKKGPATDNAVDINQGTFLDVLEESITKVTPIRAKAPNTCLTYYLCVYQEGDDVRGELSLATQTSSGYLVDFSERTFVLGGESGDPDHITRKSDSDDSEFNIPVSRKKKK